MGYIAPASSEEYAKATLKDRYVDGYIVAMDVVDLFSLSVFHYFFHYHWVKNIHITTEVTGPAVWKLLYICYLIRILL